MLTSEIGSILLQSSNGILSFYTMVPVKNLLQITSQTPIILFLHSKILLQTILGKYFLNWSF